MRTHTHRLLAIVFIFAVLGGHAQSQAEKTLLKTAAKEFENSEFLEALPAYSQLVSIAPDNKDYNFKYGTCLLASDEDVNKAVQHLKYSVSGGSAADARAYYYLGQAYHRNYQFADALRSYAEFKEKVDNRTSTGFREVDRLIVMAENGKALMSDIKDIKVLDKTESTTSDFFRNYDMTEVGGSIIKVPEELLSSADKKKGHTPLMYFPEGGTGEIIFSSYGNSDNLELYSVARNGSAGFSSPKKLQGVVNSPFDEDYPFLHSDGRTLYFSSKGHNSMGGYDVFKSKRDLSTGVFGRPENLDFAISSPDDDIFYVVDREKQVANFASNRNSEDGRLHVYKVAVSNASLEMAIVKGTLLNEVGDSQAAQIKVIDANTDEEIGVYRTDENGEYLIDLPGSGKYKFQVDIEDSEALHVGLVDVPSFGGLRAFNQDLVFTEVAAQEKLVINNHFDEEVEADVMALAQEIIKRRAQLDINFDGDVVAEEEEAAPFSEKTVLLKAGYGEDIVMSEVMATAEEQVTLVKKRIADEGEEREKAYARSIEFTERSEQQSSEAAQLYAEVQAATDPSTKEELLLMTSLKRAEAEESSRQATIALMLAKEVDAIVQVNEKELAHLEERNAGISDALVVGNAAMAIGLLEELKNSEDKGVLDADALETTTSISLESNREAKKVISRLNQLREERGRTAATIKTKESQLEKTKKQKDRTIIEAELTSLKSEQADYDAQLLRASDRLEVSQRQADNSDAAVILLEQIRLGQVEELAALQPLKIPTGGIEDTGRRLALVDNTTSEMELSKEELQRILIARPELLSNLDTKQRGLIQGFANDIPPVDYTSASSGSDTATTNAAVEFEEVNTNPETPDTNIDSEIAATSTSSESIVPNSETGSATDEILESVNTGQTAIPTEEVVEESVAIAASEVTEELTSASIPDRTEKADYSALSLDDLLSQLQSEYEGARSDIDNSNMEEAEKAMSTIDLNRAAIQRVEQRMMLDKYSSDYATNELKQGNVKAMQMLVQELEAEMLIIAATTETPMFAETTEESATAGTAAGSNVSPDAATRAVTIPAEIEVLAEQSGKNDDVRAFYQEVQAIDSNDDLTEVIKATSRVKTRAKFLEELKATSMPSDIKKSEAQMRRSALRDIVIEESETLESDIKIWQQATGTKLTDSEVLLAKLDPGYLAKRTIIESTGDASALAQLNSSSAATIKETYENTLVVSDEIDLTYEEAVMITDMISGEEGIPISDEEFMTADLEVEMTMETMASSKSWTTEIFTDRSSQQKAMKIREEMIALDKSNKTEAQKSEVEIELATKLSELTSDETLWKEQVLKQAAKKNETPAEVTAMVTQSYGIGVQADEIRASVDDQTDNATAATMLRRAAILDLASLDLMEHSIELEKHMSKGRPASSFTYKEALVINHGLIMDETSGMPASEEIASADTGTVNNIDEEIESGTSAVPDVTEAIAATEEPIIDETVTVVVPEEIEAVTSSEEVINNVTTPDAELSVEIPVISSIEELDDMTVMGSGEAIRRYPAITSELTATDILPILSFEDEMSLMSEQSNPTQDAIIDNLKGADVEQMAMLKTKSADLEKHKRYEKGLSETIVLYEEERKKRVVRLAEVVNHISENGETSEMVAERNRLTAEVQVLDAYTEQAKLNLTDAEVTVETLEIEQQAVLNEIAEANPSVDLSEVAINTPVEEEVITSIPDVIEEVATAEAVDEETIEAVEEFTATPAEEEISFSSTPSASYDYDAFVIPDVLTDDAFRMGDASLSRSRTIPMDVALPSGTIYQVQVGAFRNPIPQEHFSEFDPIMGAKLPNGITRYKVGLFTTETSAISARDEIRRRGYSDAFVVKYVDGNRNGIVGNNAIASSAGSNNSQGSSNNTTAQTSSSSNSTSTTNSATQSSGSQSSGTGTTNSPTGTGSSNTGTSNSGSTASNNAGSTSSSPSGTQSGASNTDYYESVANAAPATQVERIDGLFYTVQVGVYSKPVSSSVIFDISPLNSELTSSGKIKYTSGIFDDAQVADQWKIQVRQKGVSDAFVTAYYNGDRVTLDKAALIRSSQGDQVLVNLDELNSLDAGRQGQAVWEMVTESEVFSEEVASQVQFKIRMGPYFQRIPDKDVKVILDFEDGIEYGQTSDGAIIYTTLGSMTIDEAKKWRKKFLELGITDANIIALQDGREIPAQQALDFLLK